MHDPEEFQRQTIEAITDLHRVKTQILARQVAQDALLQALIAELSLEAVARVQESFDMATDAQAALIPPEDQRKEFWESWSALLEERRQSLALRDRQG